MPAAILQDTFFSADRPNFVNYGTIGPLIGHIITNGFGDQGHQFDENGNLFDWWQPDTQTAYVEKEHCLIDQYGNYTEPNVNLALNGISTLNANIGDNGGIKQAYTAYKRWVTTHGEEQRLPGLDYSPDQLFWIAAAQSYCSVHRPGARVRMRVKNFSSTNKFHLSEAMKIRITTDYHSPDQFRVLGSFSNMVDFSKSFNCPLGSNMNPMKKCEIW
jgi:neprilysin